MSETDTVTSLKGVLRFPFQGPDWQGRFAIGIGLTLANFLIPFVPGLFVAGYVLRVMRQAVRGEKANLPPWDDWGEMALDGLRLTLINLAYLSPGIVVLFAGMFLYFASSFSFPLLMSLYDEAAVFPLVMMLVFLGSVALTFLSFAIGWILVALGGIPLPMARAHFVARGETAAAFRIREWWPLLRRNMLGYFIAWVFVAGLFAVWYAAWMPVYYTFVLCWLAPLLAVPFGFYLSLVSAALFGHTYRESKAIEPTGEE